jgi:hypothetical protein
VTGPGDIDDFKTVFQRDSVFDCESQARIGNDKLIIILYGVSRATLPVTSIFEVEFDDDVPIRGLEHMFCASGMDDTEAGKNEKDANYMVARR